MSSKIGGNYDDSDDNSDDISNIDKVLLIADKPLAEIEVYMYMNTNINRAYYET